MLGTDDGQPLPQNQLRNKIRWMCRVLATRTEVDQQWDPFNSSAIIHVDCDTVSEDPSLPPSEASASSPCNMRERREAPYPGIFHGDP